MEQIPHRLNCSVLLQSSMFSRIWDLSTIVIGGGIGGLPLDQWIFQVLVKGAM